MLSNYLKISIAVLRRRKFLTFVNLFGAVLTLTVLVVTYAIFDSVVHPAGAEHRHDHVLTVPTLLITGPRGTIVSGAGKAFYDRYIASLETPDKTSFSTRANTTVSYLDGRKVSSQLRRTDAAYWQILDFDVVDGRVISADDVEQGRFVAVINEATADTYFPYQPAVGKTIVANEPKTSYDAFADIWVPLTTAQNYENSWVGNGQAMLYVDDPSKRRAVQAEFQDALTRFEYEPNPAQFNRAVAAASTPLEMLASRLVGELYLIGEVGMEADNAPFAKDLVAELIGLSTLVALLFMTLPAINMANLNIGRMLERAPEIGLRKAAGASRRMLVGQFVFENVVLCAIGGVVSLGIAPLVLAALNETFFTYGRLTMSPPVFAAGFAFVLVFGVLSGAYPAWKMAKLEPAAALRGMQHA